MTVQISVLVPTRDRRELLLRKLAAHEAQALPPEEFEVIVVDDGSRDGTSEAVRAGSWPFPVRLLEGAGIGPGPARNLAAAAAAGRYLLLSDDDVLPEPGCLEGHRAAQEAAGGAVVVGRVDIHPDLPGAATRSRLERPAHLGPQASWIAFTGQNSSLPADLFREHGGFDESYRAYGGEEMELGYRLHRAGTRFRYASSARARHLEPRETQTMRRKAFSAGHAHARIARRYASDPRVGWLLGVHPVALALKGLLLRWLAPDQLAGRADSARGEASAARWRQLLYEVEYWRGACAREGVHPTLGKPWSTD
jgi:GT2 family glycosyltransferase